MREKPEREKPDRKKPDQDQVVTVRDSGRDALRMAGISIRGTREYQQDAYYLCDGPAGFLAVICDGMGGMEHGELASQRAVECLVSDFEQLTGREDPYAFLREEAVRMDALVHGLCGEDGEPLEAGTTLVAVLIRSGAAWWISVGDSRIYLMRDGEIQSAARAHNYRLLLDERLESGEITPEEYVSEEAQAEALISYLGMGGLEWIDQNRNPFPLRAGDRILLCSDGLYKALSDDMIAQVLEDGAEDPEEALGRLMDAVRGSGRRSLDNTTAILLSAE